MKIKSLTWRISIVVTILTLFVLLATLFTIYNRAFNNHMKEAEEKTYYKLDLEVERLSKIQTSVEHTATYSVMALNACMDDTLDVMKILNNIVTSNPYVNCAALAYAPNRLEGHPYCIPTSVQYGIVNHYFSDKDLDGEYIYKDWYIAPYLKNKPFWTAPYYNSLNIPVVSYAIPVTSEARGFEGVLTLAVELKNLNSLLTYTTNQKADSVHREKEYNIILDRNTSFLTAHNTDYIMNETLFTLAESMNDTVYSHIGKEIIAGRDGETVATINGEKSVVSWRVLPNLDWTAMVVMPYSEVYASVRSLTYTTLLVALLATIIAIVILYFAVRRTLMPFNRLKGATRTLGEGKYDVQLPQQLTGRTDEIGDLGREFMRMQKAVKKNFDELVKERQAVQNSYDVLSTLIHNIVGHLRIPISNIVNYNEALATMTNNSEEAEVIKSESKQAGVAVLQDFNQLNELVDLTSSKVEDQDTMMVVSSDNFIEDILKDTQQLEKRFMLTIKEEYRDKRKINIRSNTQVLESLLYELIVEAAKTSNTKAIGLYFTFNANTTALRIMIEAKTDKPIPEEKKPNFFTRFAEQKVDAYSTSELLPLYICYRTAMRLGIRLFVESDAKKNKESNVFVVEIPKAE